MNATVLLGTLKRSGLSNTATLCEFLTRRMQAQGIEVTTVKLVDHDILAGTHSDEGEGDAWPVILAGLLRSDIVVFATPIWWGNQSSLIQRVIERLDEMHDKLLAGEPSPLDGKVGGIVITGDSDGAEHVIGNVCNFFNAVGILVPPYATLSVLWDRQGKKENPSRAELLEKYEKDYAATADRLIGQLLKYARG